MNSLKSEMSYDLKWLKLKKNLELESEVFKTI